jgi:hypothetical protein
LFLNFNSTLGFSEQPQNRMLDPSTRKSALEDSHHFTTQVPSQNAEEARTKELLQKVTIKRKA